MWAPEISNSNRFCLSARYYTGFAFARQAKESRAPRVRRPLPTPIEAQRETDEANAQAGELRKHTQVRSKYLPAARDIVVYLPGAYRQDSRRRFSVLYMQDGQNLFDPATSFAGTDWRMGPTADWLIREGRIRPLVIVGIYNTGKQRIREYTPARAKKLGGGGADRYGKMLLEEIMPAVASEYRILPGPANTGLGGSSLGALLTIYLGLRFPRVFGRLAVLSPSVWWADRWIVSFAKRVRPAKARPRIWLDVGTNEAEHTTEDARLLRDVLLKKGWQDGRDLRYTEIEGAQHNEAAWAQRVGPFLEFLYPAAEAAV
jgi:predicted alpha/beta superfamily hydrolase